MKKKGFTLVELLVVIAIIALLMGILMPALAKVRQVAYRMVCGSNLGGIGKAMLIYSNDNDEEFPRSGTRRSPWSSTGSVAQWAPASGTTNVRQVVWGTQNPATVTSALYLLVKYADVTPKQFICKGDIGARVFDLGQETGVPQNFEIQDAWDFGLSPADNCSYAYHLPFPQQGGDNPTNPARPISPVLDPGSPVCADRNPWMDKNATIYLNDTTLTNPTYDASNGYQDTDKKWVAAAHQREGQNVLYLDGHVEFERFPNVGLDNDNIYRHWSTLVGTSGTASISKEEKQIQGIAPTSNGSASYGPYDFKDAYLVLEKN